MKIYVVTTIAETLACFSSKKAAKKFAKKWHCKYGECCNIEELTLDILKGI